MKASMFLLSTLWLSIKYVDCQLQCFSGYRLHSPVSGPDVCVPCEDGKNFISEEHHSHRKCRDCTKVDNPDLEIVDSNCSRTRDTGILCRAGYFRYRARNDQETDRCQPCRQCEHPARACEGYHDTVCCFPNHDAVMTSGGRFVCKERPVVCGPGQFFVKASEECMPCPHSTTMPSHNHTHEKCLNCETLPGNTEFHSVIERPCTSTSQTLFGCQPGYFRDPLEVPLQFHASCSRCLECHHRVLKPCHTFHDAICDDQEHTTVIERLISPGDVPDGPKPSPDKNLSSPNKLRTGDLIDSLTQSTTADLLPVCQTPLTKDNLATEVIILMVALVIFVLAHEILACLTFIGTQSPGLAYTNPDRSVCTRMFKLYYRVPWLVYCIVMFVHASFTLITAFVLWGAHYEFRYVTSVIYAVTMVPITVIHAAIVVCTHDWFVITPKYQIQSYKSGCLKSKSCGKLIEKTKITLVNNQNVPEIEKVDLNHIYIRCAEGLTVHPRE